MEYLEFEKTIQELDEQVEKCWEIGSESNIDVSETCTKLIDKRDKAIEDLFKNITPWQRVQLSRHPNRPYTLDYIKNLTEGNFIELHGDRNYADDRAMIGAIGEINGKSYMFIGQQKGRNTKERQLHNFGMPNPEGYRKALRLMKMAEKFNIPIITLIDTPGAYPGLEAEERGQGEAIARNIYEMCNIQVPIICIIIGEGASGGALGIGVGDKIFMLENTWYSVISPESCSSILWRSWEYKEQAAEVLKLTAQDMSALSLIDGIIDEPKGGAHRNPDEVFKAVKSTIVQTAANLRKMNPENRVKKRREKFYDMGNFNE